MPALVESMFSVREKPWHGLGIIVQEAPTSEDALHLAGLDWDVVQYPVFVQDKEVEGVKANVRSSDESVLGIVSKKYKIVQNKEAFSFTDSLLDTGDVRYETAGSLRNGKTIWLLAQLPKTTILGDEIDQYLVFMNSHDGQGAVRCFCTPVRVVCNNTLNAALDGAKRCWSFRHLGDIESNLQAARNTLVKAEEYMDALAVEADKFANTGISDTQFYQLTHDLFPITKDMTDRQKAAADYNLLRRKLEAYGRMTSVSEKPCVTLL